MNFLLLRGVAAVFVLTQVDSAVGGEFRGLWVDAYHPGLNSAQEVSNVVATARSLHLNALVVEVRKRGDAYYRSRFEAMARGWRRWCRRAG